MTRETKVGLIVGLAFIVVFAVILSHKGGQPNAASTSNIGPIVDATPGMPGSASDAGRGRPRPTGNTAAPRTDGRNTGPSSTVVNPSPHPQPTSPDAKAERPTNLTASPAGAHDSNPAGTSTATPRVPLPDMPTAVKPQADRGNEPLTPSLKTWLEYGPQKPGDASADATQKLQRMAPPTPTPPAPTPAPPVDAKPTPTNPRTPTPVAPPSVTGDPAQDIKPRIKQEYVVRDGDTLTKITKKLYGKSSQKEIDAVLAANKKELPDAKKLRAGAKLAIPELPADQFEAAPFPPSKSRTQLSAETGLGTVSTPPSKESGTESADSEAPKNGKEVKGPKDSKDAKETRESKDTKDGAGTKEKPDKSSNWKWYTVQEGETFAAIARKHLGNADRWKEIAELNKGKFRDPLRVPAGAKIKLPSSIGSISKL